MRNSSGTRRPRRRRTPSMSSRRDSAVFFFQAEDGIRYLIVTGVQTCALPILRDKKEDFYLTVSRLEPYKRVDLLVEAFARRHDRRLVVIGDGPELRRLRSKASPNVEFLGRLPTPDVREHMQRARAFLFAGIEDFGIVMAEAQACGTPVIALGHGGADELVRSESWPQPTGVLFADQTADSVLEAGDPFPLEGGRFVPRRRRAHPTRLDPARLTQRV